MAYTTEMNVNGAVTKVTHLDHSAQEVDDAVEAAKKALPKTGGAMSGNISFSGGDPILYTTTYATSTRIRLYSGRNGEYNGGAGLILTNKHATAAAGDFSIYAHDGTNAATLRGTPNGIFAWNGNHILHTGNKPTGSYTGNGSAASRTIETGGMGDYALVRSQNGLALLSSQGGLTFDYSTGAVATTAAYCSDGDIKTTTANKFVNENGIAYYYQVL